MILVDKQIDTLGERMAMEIYNFAEMIKWHIFQPQRSGINSLGGTAVCDTWTFAHAGNIGDRDHIQEVSRTIQHIRQNAKLKQGTEPIVQQPRSFTEDTYTGYGTYFFPPITVAKGHKPTIEELIHNTPSPWTYSNKAFDMKIGPHQVIVNGDGFVFIETESKEQALQIFNLIMACGSFYNLSLYAVREHELAKAGYDEKNLALTGMQWNTGTRRSYLFENRYNPKNMSATRIMVRPRDHQRDFVKHRKVTRTGRVSRGHEATKRGTDPLCKLGVRAILYYELEYDRKILLGFLARLAISKKN